jgi:hypothetical protein
MRDIFIEQDDSPGAMALIGEVLGAAGVNIEGLVMVARKGRGIIHFAVEDAVTARRVLENSGIRIKEVSEVYVFHKDEKGVTGKPGSFGEICRTFADHGIHLKFGYPAENNRFVFGIDDVARARALLG